ncbi:AraC-like DNA-binding protein [Paenibacillus cellulosilyticus]|uniref:AraC-like DNA-binding protein n=1 Tax=Paenibacillus cellulosilyticus TaxID=375489 RepID=A0A2V2Z2F6_9BACL|nr:AraC family transcriptional regulator [Paenibacillus cellulosilyticus]PWW08456.1 AraC-like DNA-binding protein [Paenibacillus cellulosilyticus]QKS48863.1 helix-turn-helix transcriptional regulator [Paenibacillus cellulosilyticus]
MEFSQFESIYPEVFLFVDRRCFPDWEIIRNKIDFYDLTFVVGGKADYYVDGQKITVEAGDMLFIQSGSVREAHTYKDDPMHSYAFNFLLAAPHDEFRFPFETVTKNQITNEILNYILEFNRVWSGMQPGHRLAARGIFILLLHHLLSSAFQRSPETNPDDRIIKIKEYIIDHFPDELDMSTLSKVVNLHPVYLGKLFKTNTGYSIRHFINFIRVNNAEMMLSSGGFSVSDAAQRCGYNDISYFSNVFRAIKGYPPSKAGMQRCLVIEETNRAAAVVEASLKNSL